MKKGGLLERFRDRVLTPWWSRYLIVPVLAGAPTALATLWFEWNKTNTQPYPLKDAEAYVLFIAAGWAAVLTLAKSALNELSAYTVNELKRSRDELVRLVANLRWIVGAKSRRFHEALVSTATRSPEDAFLSITRPDFQIKQIVRSIHGFFSSGVDYEEERVTVLLMKWGKDDSPQFVEYSPDSDPPIAQQTHFKGRNSIAGIAFHDRKMVICEDVSGDKRFLDTGGHRVGSMIAYPIRDDLSHEVVFVVNVFSTKPKRFRNADYDAIRNLLEVFSDRLLLEDRLRRVRERAQGSGGGATR